MAVAFYKGTLSLENAQDHPHFILQLLASDQYRLVRLLGQKSGRTTDKISKLKDAVSDYRGFPCLNQAAALMACDIIEWVDAGDHILAICDVVSYANLRDAEILTTGYLRDKKIIRA
jgi:flavin reductase (DIM6/NTAB) family NADH-FMN oxidoreductase RutF